MMTIVLHNLMLITNTSYPTDVIFQPMPTHTECELIKAGNVWYCYCPPGTDTLKVFGTFFPQPTQAPSPDQQATGSVIPTASIIVLGVTCAALLAALVVSRQSREDYGSLDSVTTRTRSSMMSSQYTDP